MAENQFIWACRYDQDKMLMFRLNVRKVKKCDLRHSECGMVTVTRWAALSNSIAASLLGFSHTWFTENNFINKKTPVQPDEQNQLPHKCCFIMFIPS